MRAWLGPLLGVWLATAGCGERSWPAPVPEALAPASVHAGEVVEVVIRGRSFLPRVQVHYGDSGKSQVDGTFVARLGEVALEDVRYVSTTELRARLPATLPAGTYPLTVVAPTGGVGVLAHALEVLPGPTALHVAFVSPPQSVPAGACSGAVEVELQDGVEAAATLGYPFGLALASEPEGALQLFADAACSTPLTQLTLPPGASRAAFHVSGKAAGAASVKVTSVLGVIQQAYTVTGGPIASVTWEPIASPQRQGMGFAVMARAVDAYGNPASGSATLSVTPAMGLLCLEGCGAGGEALLTGGEFRARVSLASAAADVRLMLSSGEAAGESNAFEVVTFLHTPPLARLARSLAVLRAGESLTLDASGSSDAETPAAALEVSWDPEGAASLPAPWSAWTVEKSLTHTFATPGLFRARVAVRDADGDVGYARTDVLVLDAAAELCVVTNGGGEDDGATTCADPDLSLVEAIRLSNARAGKQTITFAPGLQVSMDRLLVLTDDVDIIGPSGLPALAGTQWQVNSGRVLLSTVALRSTGSGRAFGTVYAPGSLQLSDVSVQGYGALTYYGTGALEGSRFSDCNTVCVVVEQGAGDVRFAGSRFAGSSANGINFHGCGEGGARHEVVGCTFTGNLNKGFHVKSSCGPGPVVAANNTFDRIQTAVSYDTGTGHVLVNNVFSNLSSDVVKGCPAGAFATKSHNLVFASPTDACGTGTEDGSVVADPQFISGSSGDYRLMPTSPARDRGLDSGQDVTPWAPGRFLGPAPDLGGAETW